MANQQLIRKLAESEEAVVPVLFKPVQFKIIKKLSKGKKLTENEKRYLRGNMKEKLKALEQLKLEEHAKDSASAFLDSIGSYYITGLEALKHNGYGWYFNPKSIEVMNTRIEGSIRITGAHFKFIRLKSIEGSEYIVDKETGLKYAANEQVFKDAKFTKNEYAQNVWLQMLSRYGKLFVKNAGKFKDLLPEEKEADYAKFGV